MRTGKVCKINNIYNYLLIVRQIGHKPKKNEYTNNNNQQQFVNFIE